MPALPSRSRILRDLRLVARQVRYEQLAFWRNPIGAGFTIVFAVLFLVFLGATGKLKDFGNLPAIDYYLPGFLAYGVMAACFNQQAIGLVIRRQMGLLKRLRLTPLPTWGMFGGLFGNALVICVVEVALLLLVGGLGYGADMPANIPALALALIVGVLCFCALGVGVSTLVPNEDAAGPMISIVYFVLLFISGLWFPLDNGSTLAQISGYFPVRPFILATLAPFQPHLAGGSAFAWHDLLVMAIWGAAATVVALRRFRWEPRKK
jgi:ABC-2 type transport system permease protein